MAVQMDYKAVTDSANGFGDVGNVLRAVNVALEAAIRLLETTAFIGQVGGAAVAAYLRNIQPKVAELAKTCSEMGSDLQAAVESRRAADQEAAPKFEG